ncbi:amino acid/polyamine/organocation transporter, APC superfamily [Singulisphaera sp. GP187]|uniref:APC family permease n=1 Tax=Singulisphaera sp. GP187 TaxID=1882752 RepID=UPI00092A04C2|nr:amino acid permease [Singulisphaera sp. GP187]SIO66308.1 amino acid/polyamine/organocation transporter, APC superfamily [Singulisphaera sp. GP187]
MPKANCEPRTERAEVGESPPRMPAEFGLPMATFIIVASMVGVGILTTSGFTVYFVGSNQLMLGLWVLGGVIAASGALTLCELSAAMPKTGGDYVYLHEAYGPLAAFLSGWVSFLIGFAAPSAAAAFGAAKFLLVPLHLEGPTALYVQRGLASFAILAFATIHTRSRSGTAQVQGWITSLKLIILVLFVLAGLAVGWPHHANLVDLPPMTGSRVVAMMFSLVYISYAYIGWNAASYLAGEIHEPQRLLPRAILLGTAGVVALYLGLNVVYALALSANDVRAIVDGPGNRLPFKPEAVAPIAQLAAQRLFGTRWSDPLSVSIGLMLLSSLSAYVLVGPRVIYAMAHAGQFPKIASRLSTRSATPVVATVLQVVCTLTLLWSGSFDSLVIYASVGLAIFSMLTISAVYVLRVKRPELHRPFKTPGYPVTPAIYLGFTALLTAAAFSERFWVSTYSLLSIMAGIPIYYLWQRSRRSSAELPTENAVPTRGE